MNEQEKKKLIKTINMIESKLFTPKQKLKKWTYRESEGIYDDLSDCTIKALVMYLSTLSATFYMTLVN